MVRAGPTMQRRGPDRLLTLLCKPGGPRIALLTNCVIADSQHSSGSFVFDGRRNQPNIIDQSAEFTDAKNIAPAHQSVGKERFFTTEDFATGFVGITSVNSNRGLLGRRACFPTRATRPTDGFMR